MKTSELIGPTLDWAVAKCEGWELADSDKGTKNLYYKWPDGSLHVRDLWHPSTNWEQGGVLIEQEKIGIGHSWDGDYWLASSHDAKDDSLSQGPTPLIAAMRCLVASRLGDEVEIPNELQGVT